MKTPVLTPKNEGSAIERPAVQLAAVPAVLLRLDRIQESPLNPRTSWPHEEELAASLVSRGQLEAVVVREKPGAPGFYELGNGARRWRAAKRAGLTELLAKVVSLSDVEMLDLVLSSGGEGNAEPLSPLDEARALADVKERLGLSERALAERYGFARTKVQRLLAIRSTLSEEALTALAQRRLSVHTAAALAALDDPADRKRLTHDILHSDTWAGEVMPQQTALRMIARDRTLSLTNVPWALSDAELLPEAGPCTTCAWLAGNAGERGAGMPGQTCLRRECLVRKTAAHRQRLAERAGKTMLEETENARVFPANESGLDWRSGYAVLSRPVPSDMLKAEIERAPKWVDLLGEAVEQLEIVLGWDQQEHAVELVKVADALAAMPAAELAIFAPAVLRKHGRSAKAEGKRKTDEPASVRVEEVARQTQEAEQRLVAAKREKAIVRWLELVLAKNDWAKEAAGAKRLSLWLLIYERAVAALTEAEARLAWAAAGDGDVEPGAERTSLREIAAEATLDNLIALSLVLLLVPAVAAEGEQGPTATAWHREWLGNVEVRNAGGGDASQTL